MIRTFALTLLLATSLNAHAFLVEARSSSASQAAQQPISSSAHVRNGVLIMPGNSAATNGSSSAGPIGPGTTSAFADTTQIDGPILTTTLATADLATGSLRVYAEAGDGFASQAFGLSKWTETVTFNNISGATLEFDFFWKTEGVVTDLNGDRGSQNIQSSIELQRNNTNFSFISFKDQPGGGLGGAQYNFGTFGGPGGSFFSFQPRGNNNDGVWTTTLIGQAGGLLSATLLVPTGLASIDIITFLSVDCRTGAICDYANTSEFRFDTLPTGLTFTSESGVFLQAVPIPAAAWLFGSGLVSLGVIRRKRASASRNCGGSPGAPAQSEDTRYARAVPVSAVLAFVLLAGLQMVPRLTQALVLMPVARGQVTDFAPKDGAGDSVSLERANVVNTSSESRAVFKFDLSSIGGPVTSAVLDFEVATAVGPFNDYRIDLYSYAAGITIGVADFAFGVLIDSFLYNGESNLGFDVSSLIQTLVADNEFNVAFNFRKRDAIGQQAPLLQFFSSQKDASQRLLINAIPEPSTLLLMSLGLALVNSRKPKNRTEAG